MIAFGIVLNVSTISNAVTGSVASRPVLGFLSGVYLVDSEQIAATGGVVQWSVSAYLNGSIW